LKLSIKLTSKRKKAAFAAAILIALVLSFFLIIRMRHPAAITPDADFEVISQEPMGGWIKYRTKSEYQYYLYTPEKSVLQGDPAALNQKRGYPLLVMLHGSMGKYTSLATMGEPMVIPEVQRRLGGAFVLVLMSKDDYFTKPEPYAALIKSVVAANPKIDPGRIVLFGFSQGAAFTFELALYEPGLFRGAISSSGYYQVSPVEAIRLAPIAWYVTASRNDPVIYEASRATGRLLRLFSGNARYKEYEERGHFRASMSDEIDSSGTTLLHWLGDVLKK